MRLLILQCSVDHHPEWVAALKANGFYFDLFTSLQEGQHALRIVSYELVLTQSQLSGGNVVEWIKSVRPKDAITPFIVVAPLHDRDLRVHALESGADDCVWDGMDARELVARVRSVLRRQPIVRPSILATGNMQFDVINREVMVDKVPLLIPRRELGLLEHFMMSLNRTLTRDYLEASVYGDAEGICSNSIEVRISRLRRVLAKAGADVEIKTIRGIGYRLVSLECDAGTDENRIRKFSA